MVKCGRAPPSCQRLGGGSLKDGKKSQYSLSPLSTQPVVNNEAGAPAGPIIKAKKTKGAPPREEGGVHVGSSWPLRGRGAPRDHPAAGPCSQLTNTLYWRQSPSSASLNHGGKQRRRAMTTTGHYCTMQPVIRPHTHTHSVFQSERLLNCWIDFMRPPREDPRENIWESESARKTGKVIGGASGDTVTSQPEGCRFDSQGLSAWTLYVLPLVSSLVSSQRRQG